MSILDIILPFAIICYFIYVVIGVVGWTARRKQEENAYETMMLNPSDKTVSNYIQSFLKASNTPIVARLANVNSSARIIESQSRQAQGYPIIMQNPNVSEQMKQQLTNAFMAKGVPIR